MRDPLTEPHTSLAAKSGIHLSHETSYTCAWCKEYIREELISNTSSSLRHIGNEVKGRSFQFSFIIPYECKYDHTEWAKSMYTVIIFFSLQVLWMMAGNLSIEQRKCIFNLNVKLTNVNIWEEPSILYYILYTYFWPTLYNE